MKRSKLNPLRPSDDRLVLDAGARVGLEVRPPDTVVAGVRVLAVDAPPVRDAVRVPVELVALPADGGAVSVRAGALLRDEDPLRIGAPDAPAGGALASERSLKSKLIRLPQTAWRWLQ
jgi:hypothetical protein